MINSISELRKLLLNDIQKYQKICLLTHKNPDGDGLCACLALQELLTEQNIPCTIILEESPPAFLNFLDVTHKVQVYSTTDAVTHPLVLIIDCKDRERIGSCAPIADAAEKVFAIDHHEGETDVETYQVYNDPSRVSTGAIVYDLFRNEIDTLPLTSRLYVADNLYVTILNDTNNFTNNNTDERVFIFAADLCRLGINPAMIHKKFLSSRPASYFRFVGQALSTLETYHNDNILFFHCTKQMLSENNLGDDATSKITDWVKSVENVKVIVFFRELETPDNAYRLSLRSPNINVNKIAVRFNGGGHIAASGCEIKGTLKEVKAIILQLLSAEL